MAPADVLGVLLVGVLAVVDEQVGVARELVARDPLRLQLRERGAERGLVVGDVAERRVALGDPVAERRPAVGHRLGADRAEPISHSVAGVSRNETSQGSSRTSTGESGAEM